MSILLADIDATCAALGYSDGQRYHAEPDAVQGLKHLIWILRRDLDNHEYRRHLGHAKVLQTDLVYMLPDYVQDEEYADVLIRLLVILTNPTLLLYRDGAPKDNHGRKVFLELIDILQGYKTAFTREQIWSALFGKMQQSLEIDWALRSEEQSLLIERILVLIRNVLQVPSNPEAECRADNDASVHDQVIWALHQSGILDLVLFIVSSPDEQQFHLHGLEILCLLYREQTAESLADASLQRSVAEKQRDEQELIAVRRREKQRLLTKPPPARHSRFGGTYVIRNFKSVSDRDIICHQPVERVAAIDFDREKQKQKRSFRHVKEEAIITRRSAFSVRLCLREYCIEVLRSAYNTLIRQVRRVLERNSGSSNHDDSYLLWAIRFFMEFNRLSGMQLQLVSESLSVQCFHWVLTRMQHNMDMIVSDKKEARLWAKRLHVALQTFRELLLSMLALQKLQDDNALALFDMLLNNVCYVLEYRETILHLLMNYNEAHSTKVYLRDVVETANIFMKMMEKFCKDTVVVQDKKRGKKRSGAKKKSSNEPQKTEEEMREELENKWAEYAGTLGSLLANELEMAEEDQPIPFDATSEKSIDDQKDDCMKRINKLLREEELEKAVALLRAAREVWPENDIFGAITAAPEDELLLLREIFLHNITTVEPENAKTDDQEDESDNEEYEEMENNMMVEKTFKFEDFAKRLLNPKIVRACTIVLHEWESIPTKSLKATVTILHRIAYGCSCPAMLYQAKLFLIFQQVFNAARDAHHEELRRLGVYVVRKFVEIAPSNPKIYAELLFYKTIKEANELETGYCDAYETGTKAAWSEEQENELRLLFEENQRNPATDKDVIDWILENLIDKKRTRRGILKKLKEMGLMFKAPTKKSSSAVAKAKNLWQPEEDEELRSLYDMYRLEPDCLQKILQAFFDRRDKQAIIKRMLQIHIIADKSEILSKKMNKRQTKKKQANEMNDFDESDENEYMEEPCFEENYEEASNQSVNSLRIIANNKAKKTTKTKKSKNKNKSKKPAQRKIIRTALDVGTIRALLNQIDKEKFQEGIEWLKECIEDAAEEEDAPSEEDDGVPLLPLTSQQKEAMEDADFKKLLIALGVQPPIMGIENYWRIPIYLNKADLKIRARILAGEEIEIDVDELNVIDDNDDYDDDDNNDDEDGESDEEEEDEIEVSAGKMNKKSQSDSEDEEEDALDVFARQRKHLNALLYTKSDEEAEARAPLIKEKQKNKKKEKRKQKQKQTNKDDDDDDDEDVDVDEADINDIKRKLDRKKQKPDLSTDESGNDDDNEKEIKEKSNKKAKPAPPANAEALFEQLKTQRAKKKQKKTNEETKIQQSEMSNIEADAGDANVAADGDDDDDDDLLNFNSEDYRKRLLELGDSDDEEKMEMETLRVENDDDDVKNVVDEAEDKENFTKNKSKSNKTKTTTSRTRRINIIDSESDEEVVEEKQAKMLIAGKSNDIADGRRTDADNNDDLMGKRKSVKDDANAIENDDDNDDVDVDVDANDNNNDGVDKTGNQFKRRVEQPSSQDKKNRKQQASTNMVVIDADNKNADVSEVGVQKGGNTQASSVGATKGDDNDGNSTTDAAFIKRKKSTAQHDDDDDDDDDDNDVEDNLKHQRQNSLKDSKVKRRRIAIIDDDDDEV